MKTPTYTKEQADRVAHLFTDPDIYTHTVLDIRTLISKVLELCPPKKPEIR